MAFGMQILLRVVFRFSVHTTSCSARPNNDHNFALVKDVTDYGSRADVVVSGHRYLTAGIRAYSQQGKSL
jgi:hypothetical protein